ncbi:MAG: hypothetical protein Q7S32_01745, partial [bacterium]|nr:hypothetical protein [bacterium]
GPRNWNQQQGLYFYRNNRLLQAGGWSYLRAADEHTKLLRVAMDFPSDLDRAFSINVTKMRARIPAEIRGRLENHVSGWVKIASVRYNRKVSGGRATTLNDKKHKLAPDVISSVNVGPLIFSPNNTPDRGLIITANKKTGEIEILVPQSPDLSQIFTMKGTSEAELRKLCLAMLSILEAVYDRKIQISRIPMTAIKKIYKRTL